METTCGSCGGGLTNGALSTVRGDQLYWAPTEATSVGPFRVSRSSGGRMPVTVRRCDGCGRLDMAAFPHS